MTTPKFQATPLAAAIFAQQVDLDRPLLHKECIAKCYQAANIFGQYYNEEIADTAECAADLETVRMVLKPLREGQKILAIKEHRARTGLGLKESKDFVDNLEASLRRTGAYPTDDEIEIHIRPDGTKVVRRKP